MKQLLFEFAEVEHQLIRFKQMVDKAEGIGLAELNEQEQIGKDVMIEVLPMLQEAQAIAKEKLFSLVPIGGEEDDRSSVLGSSRDPGEKSAAALAIPK